jgi:tetratricopeptide (TPR) repeat protein
MMGWGILIVTMAATAQQPAPMSDAELSQHLATVRAQLANPGLDLGRREGLAQDMAGTLDRAAQSAPDPEVRRQRWAEAISLIDRFLRENPDLPLDRQLRLQAAVFRWAQAQTWVQAAAFEPFNTRHAERAAALLEDAIERLRSISAFGDRTTLGDNLRYRLAQAIADRAELEPAGSGPRKAREAEAMDLLEKPGTELGLGGFWHLLRSELLLRAGKPAEAGKELESALQAKPAPPEPEVFAIKVPLMIGEKQYAGAMQAVDASHLEAPIRGLWKVRIRLAELKGTPEGDEHKRIHAELYRDVLALKGSQASESRLALLELARAGIEPGPDEPPDAWDALADAYQRAGEPAKAAAAEMQAADRAAAGGQAAAAAGYRLRAGAFLFQSGRFVEADVPLSRVADDPASGPVRPRAGMLRALARGRALASGQPGASMAAFSEALERQVRDFPNDPATDEARWLLGDLALGSSSDRDRARALWTAIAAGSPRWLDARLAIASMERDELDRQLINPDRQRLALSFARADKFLADSIRQARSEDATGRLQLARARLNLVPIAGRPEAARDLCDAVARLPVSPAVLYRARLLRMIALVELGRYIEAEREAQTHSDWDLPAEHAVLFDAVRLLDQGASIATTDLRQRRFGLVLKLLLESVLTLDQKFETSQLIELKMRMTRALLFVGDDIEARRSLTTWKGTPDANSERLLRDLGDTYNRLEVYSLAVDVQRLRIHNNAAGSMPWFDAKYALALAYFHTSQYKDAAQLIDATAILHPDLGGGELHEKFIRLRQRLGEKP